jgi:ribonuclease BN (tRNA processing enzyme)
MRLTVLGSGDAFHSGGSLHSSNLVEHEGGALMLECGTGALAGLKRLGIDTNLPDAILVSHFHGDHFGGLPFYLLEALFMSNRDRPLVILGPRGVEERVLALHANMYRELTHHEFAFGLEFVDLAPGQDFEAAGFKGHAFEVDHNAEPFALGYRLQGSDRTLLFSGDSGWTEAFVEQSRDVDLFLCECCTINPFLPMHTSYAELMDHRARLGCRRMLLTHLGEDVRTAEGLLLECAYDGMVVEF